MKKENTLKIICIIFFYILVFQSVIQEYIKFFQYFDEILALISIIYFAFYIIKNRGKITVKKSNLYIFALLIIITSIGIYANVKYKYQDYQYVFADLLVFWKFFLVYLGFEILARNKIEKYKKIIAKNIKILSILFMILTILNYIFTIFPSMGYRYGIRANQLFFGHPMSLSWVCVFLLVTLIYCEKPNKRNCIYIIFLNLIIASTLRSKSIAFVIVSLIIFLYNQCSNKKIDTLKIFVVGVICLAVGYKQIYYYFMEEDTARSALLTTSIEIANDHFPTGAGFGTFGSYFSGQNYSPLYEMYEIDEVWGLRESNPNFISDSFWPMILGQFGYIGTILYVLCSIIIYIKIQKQYTIENKNIYIAKLLALMYLLISSTAESAFVSPFAIPLAIILAI